MIRDERMDRQIHSMAHTHRHAQGLKLNLRIGMERWNNSKEITMTCTSTLQRNKGHVRKDRRRSHTHKKIKMISPGNER